MLEFLCAGTDAYNRFALEAGRAIDNKKDLSTSKLVSSPLLLSAPLIYVRDYCGCLPMYARIPPST